MKRDELLREIARLDEEINQTIGSAKLPTISTRSFPLSLWLLSALCIAWWRFGYLIPGAYATHMQSQKFVFIGGIVLGILALIKTISWMFFGNSYQNKSEEYTRASMRARQLQERRRELQEELRAISGE